MNYKEFKETIVDYLSENLSEDKQQEFKQFLVENPQYNIEFETAKLFWSEFDNETPDPTPEMDMKFYAMLNSQTKSTKEVSIIKSIENFLFGSFSKQLAYTLATLAIGFFIGNHINPSKSFPEKELAVAKQEIENVRSQLVVTLLDQPSANKRLQAVNEVNKMDNVTETIIKALFMTLNNDENVNVRLSAIEALKNYTNISLVREGLVASIINQESPLVQIAMADLMVEMQEKDAVEIFKELIEKENINESAKEKMEESIQSIAI
ncbi:HEAT repeat domain-containing protein [Pontimicrobium aquaticum]|uniref:HEAT repeat domain-containing protein n=1 Tax=Pontimicrobium aquaticum TaxID=2565367 RepID=A0A4U0F0G2_9FLAO|nr:HEAT repeat domain-containing protein [Pontimicrobium aquaticum]TJY37833.1 HEAT repeat domain-containing protein [Pontimicrobium aquaticum]